MEIPDLVRERLGEEEVRAGVALGDEDAVCLTPTRTLVYRGDGLLSDESVTVLPHDVERIDLSEGRRKTALELTYVDGSESVSVPNNRAEKVLELLIEGVLRVAAVIGTEESVRGVYRFSELTLILTDGRLVKHVGSSLWDEDYEEFPFSALTGLDFEEGSVATQIVLSVDGRPQRIKAPNDEAPMLRQTLEQAVFEYHGVESLAALNEAIAVEDEADDGADADEETRSRDLTLEDGIDPLVGGEPDEESTPSGPDPEAAVESASSHSSATGEGDGDAAAAREPAGSSSDPSGATAATGRSEASTSAVPDVDANAVSREDIDAIGEQLEALTTAVERQNELLDKQQRTVAKLIEELRQGR